MVAENTGGASNEIATLINSRIETLRLKLLDTTARNPLIQTRFSEKGSSHIRVVDELPDVLFHNLNSGTSMRIIPLPDLEIDPKDEEEEKFKAAVTLASRIDEIFLEETANLEPDDEDYLNKSFKIERDMKDRIREQLDMPKRQSKGDVDIKIHARNNNITPSFDLPKPKTEIDEEKHNDTDIQTLTLPHNLERRLNTIRSKDNSFAQETGINVLHVAFGFLKWKDPKSQKEYLSPLILMPVRFDIKKTAGGVETWVNSSGEEPTLNLVLAEKLRIEFGIELPQYDGGSIEDYLTILEAEEANTLNWKSKRIIAIGIFPSSRMAMYHDLDTIRNEFNINEIISGLFAGNSVESTAAFAEDHQVDTSINEAKVPYLVKEADASQLSTLIDIVDGKNLAVEGPPGTGKSQTIVNVIAAAIAEGKKVLFVAEKAAALEVVQSRLEAVGLGEFALPLIAGRSSRDAVLQSIRTRLNLQEIKTPNSYKSEINQYRTVRDKLSKYSNILASKNQRSDLTVHEVLGKAIATSKILESLPDAIRYVEKIPDGNYTSEKMHELAVLANSYVSKWEQVKADKSIWKGTTACNLVKFQIESILRRTKSTAEQCETLSNLYTDLKSVNIDPAIKDRQLLDIVELTSACLKDLGDQPTKDQLAILNYENPEQLTTFINECHKAQLTANQIKEIWTDIDEPSLIHKMQELVTIINQTEYSEISFGDLDESITKNKLLVENLVKQWKSFRALGQKADVEESLKASDVNSAIQIIKETGKSTLDHRSLMPNPTGYTEAIRLMCKKGRELVIERNDIGKLFTSLTSLPLEIIRQDLITFKTSGKFKLFSGKYRSAKNRFLAEAKDGIFELTDAITNLQSLLAHSESCKDYKENQRWQNLIGSHFDGLNTNFEAFEGLADYIDKIEIEFSAPDLANFRKYLSESSTIELQNLPNISSELLNHTSASMNQHLSLTLTKTKEMDNLTNEIKPYLSMFKSPEQWSGKTIEENIKQIECFKSNIAQLENYQEIKQLLGDKFAGWKTASSEIKTASKWACKINQQETTGDIIRALLNSEQSGTFLNKITKLLEEKKQAENMLQSLCEEGGISYHDLIDTKTSDQIAEDLRTASKQGTLLSTYSHLGQQKKLLDDAGFGWIIDELDDNEMDQLESIINAVIWRVISHDIYNKFGSEITQFTGNQLDDLRTQLVEYDKQILNSTRGYLRSKLHDNAKPPYGIGVGKKSTYTELALLQHQTNLKKPNAPIRRLSKKAGKALLELKPCWMMSPLAVAQYLERDSLEFDLCIIDEASQMPPEDAIGALVRSKQTMIVGDTNQLPPTNFFRKMLEDDEADEDELTIEESILEMANSTFRPKRRLRWHYRSRHSGLIKLSNRLVYDDQLIVFPSPHETREGYGVFYEFVEGNYNSGLNPPEAEAIAHAAVDFMIHHPDRSLGLVALNKKQTEQIDSLIYEASLTNAAVQRYREFWEEHENGIERFFVKNLENVQGDERDVIFISTVYGPAEVGGKTAQRFGPINGLAGKRRLNVLFSRAKEQIKTFSSMSASDILATPQSNAGANMLKQWLEYSATGNLDGGIIEENREPDSDFERHVISIINGMGLKAVPQVGVSGYFIDIGVEHPDWPHGFLLGVECDGASYHSSYSARDRDRLRQEVLEGLGWHFHRIWSTDWFNDVYGETERLREAIEARLRNAKLEEASFSTKANEISKNELEEGVVKDLNFDKISQERKSAPRSDIEIASDDDQLVEPEQTQIQFDQPIISTVEEAQFIDIGDTVQVCLTSEQNSIIKFQISDEIDDIENNILYSGKPLAAAVLDKEEGDEFEYLAGCYVKKGVIEDVQKASA